MNFELELRGERVSVELGVVNPDESVGMIGYGFEDETLCNSAGDVLDWRLTDAEVDKILNMVNDRAYDNLIENDR